MTATADPAADFLATVPPHTVDRSEEWWSGYVRGFDMADAPTIGAVRRLRGHTLQGDPQADLMKAVAVEVESIRRALGRGARPDEIRGRALRLARVCEGEARAL